MRILCLHGNGTNAHIMKSQTAPLKHELDDGHEYEFVEAAVPAPLSTTMVNGIDDLISWRPEQQQQAVSQFFGFYDPDDPLPLLPKTISQLDEYISAEGPFDVLLGFSAGAVLSALYLAQKQQQLNQGQTEAIPVKCAILMASDNVPEAALGLLTTTTGTGEEGVGGVDASGGQIPHARICIPSVHIWGANDVTAPMGGLTTSWLFDETTRHTLVHDGGHEFPKKQYLTDAAHLIRRVLASSLRD